ncbi:MAG: HAMP domain-containing histidine kinase [Ruminococcus sp.]|nr:HAMP domain-containing histidine kinase [Ruminococcus sp.]
MDWFMSIIIILALGITAFSLWKMHRLKQEVWRFAEKAESSLDRLISGKEIGTDEEDIQDTLWGKCKEKFSQAERIWKRKDEASLAEKKQMKELISDISHQTRTPIANMKLYLEFLQEETLSENGTGFLKNLERQADKLDFLLQSMVKMSRLETGIIRIKTEPGNLYDTLTRSVTEIVPKAAKKQIQLSVDCPEDFPLRYDQKWTEEAIFNVLDNAVKYIIPADSCLSHRNVEPGISLEPVGSNGKIHIKVIRQEIFTKIGISDTGKGIAPERQAEIFTRFYREPEVHEQSGVGIGLYLTRKILELQGGYIEVKSETGKGSEFCLYLPND